MSFAASIVWTAVSACAVLPCSRVPFHSTHPAPSAASAQDDSAAFEDDARAGRPDGPELVLRFAQENGLAAPYDWRLSSLAAPASWTALPLGTLSLEVRTGAAPLEMIELVLDGRRMAATDYYDPNTQSYRLPALAPGRHVVQARVLRNQVWSRHSAPLRIELLPPKAPRIVAVSDQNKIPIATPLHAVATISGRGLALRLADVEPGTKIIAYLNGEPSAPATVGRDDGTVLVTLQGAMPAGRHSLTVRAVHRGSQFAGAPSNEVTLSFYQSRSHVLRPGASCCSLAAPSTAGRPAASGDVVPELLPRPNASKKRPPSAAAAAVGRHTISSLTATPSAGAARIVAASAALAVRQWACWLDDAKPSQKMTDERAGETTRLVEQIQNADTQVAKDSKRASQLEGLGDASMKDAGKRLTKAAQDIAALEIEITKLTAHPVVVFPNGALTELKGEAERALLAAKGQLLLARQAEANVRSYVATMKSHLPKMSEKATAVAKELAFAKNDKKESEAAQRLAQDAVASPDAAVSKKKAEEALKKANHVKDLVSGRWTRTQTNARESREALANAEPAYQLAESARGSLVQLCTDIANKTAEANSRIDTEKETATRFDLIQSADVQARDASKRAGELESLGEGKIRDASQRLAKAAQDFAALELVTTKLNSLPAVALPNGAMTELKDDARKTLKATRNQHALVRQAEAAVRSHVATMRSHLPKMSEKATAVAKELEFAKNAKKEAEAAQRIVKDAVASADAAVSKNLEREALEKANHFKNVASDSWTRTQTSLREAKEALAKAELAFHSAETASGSLANLCTEFASQTAASTTRIESEKQTSTLVDQIQHADAQTRASSKKASLFDVRGENIVKDAGQRLTKAAQDIAALETEVKGLDALVTPKLPEGAISDWKHEVRKGLETAQNQLRLARQAEANVNAFVATMRSHLPKTHDKATTVAKELDEVLVAKKDFETAQRLASIAAPSEKNKLTNEALQKANHFRSVASANHTRAQSHAREAQETIAKAEQAFQFAETARDLLAKHCTNIAKEANSARLLMGIAKNGKNLADQSDVLRSVGWIRTARSTVQRAQDAARRSEGHANEAKTWSTHADDLATRASLNADQREMHLKYAAEQVATALEASKRAQEAATRAAPYLTNSTKKSLARLASDSMTAALQQAAIAFSASQLASAKKDEVVGAAKDAQDFARQANSLVVSVRHEAAVARASAGLTETEFAKMTGLFQEMLKHLADGSPTNAANDGKRLADAKAVIESHAGDAEGHATSAERIAQQIALNHAKAALKAKTAAQIFEASQKAREAAVAAEKEAESARRHADQADQARLDQRLHDAWDAAEIADSQERSRRRIEKAEKSLANLDVPVEVQRAHDQRDDARAEAERAGKMADARIQESLARERTALAAAIQRSASPFVFASTAHFPLPRFGRDGQRFDAEGLVIYEDMEFRFDRHGRYEVRFQATAPKLPTTLRLQFEIQTGPDAPWQTITLAPIEFAYPLPEKSLSDILTSASSALSCVKGRGGCDGECCGARRECVCKGTSEVLKKCYAQIGEQTEIRRRGSARFGYDRADTDGSY